MKLYDLALEERVAVGFVFDRDVRDFGDELECADFVTHLAGALFAAARNVQAGSFEPTLARVEARIVRDDLRCGSFKSIVLDRDAILDMLVDRVPFGDAREIVDAVRALRALRIRRERVIAIADRSVAEKRQALERERFTRST